MTKLRQAKILVEQGKSVAEVIGVTEPTYYQRQAKYGGLKIG